MKLFIASYHALSGAMYCAMALQDQEKREEVHRLAVEHFDSICQHFTPASAWDEQLEISLYRSLVKLADPTRKFRLN
ncbi:hypothetical protein EON83_16805 [bacterium]|nr:MAG: hypothetical protein EON83_16805 [bacterium]